MSAWTKAYEEAHAAVKNAAMAIRALVKASDEEDEAVDRVRCAGDALQGVRALLSEAGQIGRSATPQAVLDVDRIMKTARLRRGKNRRQIWHSGTDVCKQLDEMHKIAPAETRRLIHALEDGLGQARQLGLHIDPHDSGSSARPSSG
jgi:hypothetical protein